MEHFNDSNNSDFEEEYNRSSDDQNDHVEQDMVAVHYNQSEEYEDNNYTNVSGRKRNYSKKFETPGYSQSNRNHYSSESVRKHSRRKRNKTLSESTESTDQEHRDYNLPRLDCSCGTDSPSSEMHKRKYDSSSDDSNDERHSKMLRIGETRNSIGGGMKAPAFVKFDEDYDPPKFSLNSKKRNNNVIEHTEYKESHENYNESHGNYSEDHSEVQSREQHKRSGIGFHLPNLDDTPVSQRFGSAFSDNHKRKFKTLSDESSSEDERRKRQMSGYSNFKRQHSSSSSPEMFKKNYEQTQSRKILQPTTQKSTGKKMGNIAANMMKKMGYQEGTGLGKHGQGRLEPVQAAKQRGYRGLGLHLPGLETASIKWDPQSEKIRVKEDIQWIMSTNEKIPTLDEMKNWIAMGAAKQTIDDETLFCSPETVRNVVDSKTVFDNLDKTEMYRARTRSNPFETIRGAFFLNRAAVKMANMDRACNFMFTKPKNLKSNELLYFADVCAGPGGFSEYVLWRKKWRAKGFGFTLKNENDFKLHEFYAGPCETFHPFYGPKENGDVFDPDNQNAFTELIMKHTNGIGVHFMMSDGGFSVSGQENIQEILSKQLYLCQCLMALMIVRPGGHFVTKVFDLFTPFSAGLVFLMYLCFDEICIFKPNTSRPANSERYLICKNKRRNTYNIMQYLQHINKLLIERNSLNDVIEIVPFSILEEEWRFLQYLRMSNEVLGEKQITGLLKIAAYCQDTTLMETRQGTIRKECLKYWEIPDENRVAPNQGKPQDRLRSILKIPVDFLSSPYQDLTPANVDSTVTSSPYDWFCVPCNNGACTEEHLKPSLFMSMGRSKVYRYSQGAWKQLNRGLKVDLPPDTLVYAEFVKELRGEGMSQRKIITLQIIDAYMLGKEDVSQKYIEERHGLTKMFCEALWKPYAGEYTRVRVKELHPVDYNLAQRLRPIPRSMKCSSKQWLTYDMEQSYLDDEEDDGQKYPLYFVLQSVLFLKSTCSPWSRHCSKTTNLTYVFNSKTRKALFDRDRPKEAEANFVETFKPRCLWNWPDNQLLPMETLVQKIREKCPQRVQKAEAENKR